MTAERIAEAERALSSYVVSPRIVLFGRALAELVGSVFDWPYYLEKPHKWAPEYVAWQENGEPLDYSEAGWEPFVDAVEEAHQ